MSRPSPEAIELAARMCLEKATAFWNINGWEITLTVNRIDGNTGADIAIEPEYMQAHIRISDDAEDLPTAWEYAAHEVAHLALADLEFAEAVLWPDDAPRVWNLSIERAVTNLTRVFIREHPYPAT